MKIALIGNGKMGKKINELASQKGHFIVCCSDSKTSIETLDLSNADVAIDFSTPDSAFQNITHAIYSNIPVISGTTGWLDKKSEIEDLCIKKKGAFLYSSNFSIGVNIFFQLNKILAKLMQQYKYDCTINEIHHTDKIDSPSGTSITLKQDIDTINKKNITVKSQRVKDTVGTHRINYSSLNDEIEIKHTAKNREGFAKGAILAAEWIIGKKGVFNMNDIIK